LSSALVVFDRQQEAARSKIKRGSTERDVHHGVFSSFSLLISETVATLHEDEEDEEDEDDEDEEDEEDEIDWAFGGDGDACGG